MSTRLFKQIAAAQERGATRALLRSIALTIQARRVASDALDLAEKHATRRKERA